MSVARYGALPSVPARMPLEGHVFAILVPIARTNEITNPSFETGTTSWAAVGGSIARVTSWQASGAAGLQITMSGANDGVRYSSLAITAGEVRACSCWFQGTAGRRYRFQIEDGGGGAVARVVITATGLPQQVVWYAAPTTTATYYLFVGALAAGADVVYLDAVQVEVIQPGETYSTYIDGDQAGLIPNQAPPAYGWNGTPHASTSYRSAQTRAGGMVMPLSYYNFLLTAIIGLGLAIPQNVATDYARLDGAYPDYTRKPTRQLTLTGRIEAPTELQLRAARGDLAAVLDRDASALDQMLRLRYWREDACGAVASAVAQLNLKYQSGLEGNHTNPHMEDVPLTFAQYAPYITAATCRGAGLVLSTSVANTNRIAQRSAGGRWASLGTGASGSVLALAYGPDGTLYAGGSFNSMGGVANTNGIAKWNGSAWSALGTGAAVGGVVYGLAVDASGIVYATGDFSLMGGVANTVRIAKWNGSAWSAMSTGLTGGVGTIGRALVVGADGAIYATGIFTTAGGVAASHIAKWDGSAWSALGSGLSVGVSDLGLALTRAPNGNIVVGGRFTTAGGSAADNIAAWDGSAWSALGAPGMNAVNALAYRPDGTLYAGGETAPYIQSWNGVAWSTLGGGLSGPVRTLASTPLGLYAGGTFRIVLPGPLLPDGFALWNGATWLAPDIDLPGTPIVYALLVRPDGTLTIGHDRSGTSTAAAQTTVSNPGTARSYPTFRISGPSAGVSGEVYLLRNITTGRSIYLNLSIPPGDVATLVFQPDNLSFTSRALGNVARTILPGSNEADFFLAPGDNVIAAFAPSGINAIDVFWQPTYASLDDVP